MKKSLYLLASLLFGSASVSQALVVLTVDFTDPSAVVITATGNNSLVTASDSIQNGFQLLNAIPNNTDGTGNFESLTTTLRPAGTGSASNTVQASYADSSQSGGLGTLLMYASGVGPTWSVTTGESAFSGTATLDLSAASSPLIGALPPVGSTGDVVLGYTSTSGVIGTWEAVPEPSHYALFSGSLFFAFILWNRRRAAASKR